MFLLIPLLLVTSTGAIIPPIDGVDRSGFFNYMRQEFEQRRLFVDIVDSLSSSSDKRASPVRISIDLLPIEGADEYYDFASRRVAAVLKCDEDVSEDIVYEVDPGDYFLHIDENATIGIIREPNNTEDRAMLRRIARLVHMDEEEIDKIQLSSCSRSKDPKLMRIRVTANAGSQIQSGWIVERYPLGNFSLGSDPNYRYPIYLANHSFVDAQKELIVDVHERIDDNGKRVWVPTGWPTFAKLSVEHVDVARDVDVSFVRETATGLLIATTAQNLSLAYMIDDDLVREVIHLDGRHFHVSCDRKLGSRHPDDAIMSVVLGDKQFSCSRNRATPTGVPELLQLDFVQTSGSRTVPSSDRIVTMELQDRDPNNEGLDQYWKTIKYSREDDLIESDRQLPVNPTTSVIAEDKDFWLSQVASLSWTEFVLLSLILVSFLITIIVFTVKCLREYVKRSRDPIVRAWVSDRHGEDRRRKGGNRELADASRQSTEAINKKCDEREEEARKLSTVSATRPRSFKKTSNSITFAPRKPSLTREELFKMVNDVELGIKIDAMIAAGPDGEETEEEKEMAAVAAAAAAAATVAPAAAPELTVVPAPEDPVASGTGSQEKSEE